MSDVENLALKKLFLEYKRDLQSYLTRKFGDAELASDLTQETFLRVAELNKKDLSNVSDSRAYLFRTAHNLALDHFRRKTRQKTDVVPTETLSDIRDELPSQEDYVDARSRLARITAAIDELPELTQNIFILNRIDGLTYAEVARRLSISDSSVQKHLARALFHVAGKLGKAK